MLSSQLGAISGGDRTGVALNFSDVKDLARLVLPKPEEQDIPSVEIYSTLTLVLIILTSPSPVQVGNLPTVRLVRQVWHR
ncbi:hypothetical protein [Synechococcus sp. PCC 7336]|uniref:hypothetical protein n=1 Tax=Synechococcus sp. PCC 7336 TaxID=195250 RepID=UPI000348B55A|nr:hypothetical protein [Synechococcus sp. PCC 7336]